MTSKKNNSIGNKGLIVEVIAFFLSVILSLIGYITTDITEYSKKRSYNLFKPWQVLEFCRDQYLLSQSDDTKIIDFSKKENVNESNKVVVIDHTKSSAEYATNNSDFTNVLEKYICSSFTDKNRQDVLDKLRKLGQKDLILIGFIKAILTNPRMLGKKISVVDFDGTGRNNFVGQKWNKIIIDTSASTDLIKYIDKLDSNWSGAQWSNFEQLFNDVYTEFVSDENDRDSAVLSFHILSDLIHEEIVPGSSKRSNDGSSTFVPYDNLNVPIEKINKSKIVNHFTFLQFLSKNNDSNNKIYECFKKHVDDNCEIEKMSMQNLLNDEKLIIKKILYSTVDVIHQDSEIYFFKVRNFPIYKADEYKCKLKVEFPSGETNPNEPDNFLIKLIDHNNEQRENSFITVASPDLSKSYSLYFNEVKSIGLMSGSVIDLSIKVLDSDPQKLKLKIYNYETQKCYVFHIIMMKRLSKGFSLFFLILTSFLINFLSINLLLVSAQRINWSKWAKEDWVWKIFFVVGGVGLVVCAIPICSIWYIGCLIEVIEVPLIWIIVIKFIL